MESWWHDIRYGFRMLWKNPVFTAVAVLTLALGIGANTAIFSVVHGVLLRPLPFAEPDRLMVLWTNLPNFGTEVASLPDFVDWKQQGSGFADMAAMARSSANLAVQGEPERVIVARASAAWFSVLALKPLAGRFYTPAEDTPSATRVAVLSHGLWQRRFGGKTDVIGQSVVINSTPYTVIGVAPPETDIARAADVYAPLALDPANMGRRSDFLYVVGRLKPGVTPAQAQAEMDTVAARLSTQYPNTNLNVGVLVRPLHDDLVGKNDRLLFSLWAAVGFVMLIVVANVANLLLARGAAREKELAIRAALGAGRTRIVRQLLTESLTLGALGGAIGLLLAYWLLEGLLAVAPADLPLVQQIVPNATVLAFAIAAAFVAAVLFGAVPALYGARADVHDSLKEGGRASANVSRHGLRRLLVVAEISLSLLLLVGAGVMIRTVYQLQKVDAGFRSENLLTFRLTLPPGRYNAEQQVAFYDRLLGELRARPGVASAAALSQLYLSDGANYLTFGIEGEPPRAPGDNSDAQPRAISPDLFSTMGVRVMRGRGLNAADAAGRPNVALVNEEFVRRYYAGQDLIGRRVSYNNVDGQPQWREIVGIMGDIRQSALDERSYPEIVVPMAQAPQTTMTVVLRTESEPTGLAGMVREQVKTLDPLLPVYNLQTMEEVVAKSIAGRSFQMYLLAAFAMLALLLAAVGIYGVMAQAVAQRTPEFGVRLALGAQPQQILRLVLAYGARMTAIGLAVGLLGAMALARFMSSFVFGVSPRDPWTLLGVSLLLAAVATLASLVPAWRAMKVDPMVALRYE